MEYIVQHRLTLMTLPLYDAANVHIRQNGHWGMYSREMRGWERWDNCFWVCRGPDDSHPESPVIAGPCWCPWDYRLIDPVHIATPRSTRLPPAPLKPKSGELLSVGASCYGPNRYSTGGKPYPFPPNDIVRSCHSIEAHHRPQKQLTVWTLTIHRCTSGSPGFQGTWMNVPESAEARREWLRQRWARPNVTALHMPALEKYLRSGSSPGNSLR